MQELSMWDWDGEDLVGWVGSLATPMKTAHLRTNPHVSCSYWDGAERYDTCVADCRAELLVDEQSKVEGWERFKAVPPPLGYDPAIIPQWKAGPTSPHWGVMRLEPWRLRVFPGVFAKTSGAEGEILTWQED